MPDFVVTDLKLRPTVWHMEKDVIIRVAREDSATAGHFAISIHGSRDDEGGTEGAERKEGSGAVVSWFGSFGIEKSLQ